MKTCQACFHPLKVTKQALVQYRAGIKQQGISFTYTRYQVDYVHRKCEKLLRVALKKYEVPKEEDDSTIAQR